MRRRRRPTPQVDPAVLAQLAEWPAAQAPEFAVDREARRWTVRLIALLLVLQALTLVTISGIYLMRVDWDLELGDVMLSVPALEAVLLALLLTPIGLFELATALGVWMRRPDAWLHAMIVQGILLIFCLVSYVTNRGESFIYLLMLICIVLVLYLNANDVRLSFSSRRTSVRAHRS